MAHQITRLSRYQAAAALLDDCAALARLARIAATVKASEEPCVAPLAGGRNLRAATRVGFFAGSFNPLTRAHVALVNAAWRSAGLDAVIWACAVASVNKEQVERAALVDRLAQMRAFVGGRRRETLALLNRGLYLDEARIGRALLSPRAELLIIVGFDKIVQIFDPQYYDDRDAALRELFALTHLLVAPRDNDGARALAALLARPENRPFAAHVRYLDVAPTYARDSSTEARALLAQISPDEAAISRLLPPAGAALGLAAGPYRPVTDAARDPYQARARWLDALATLPPATTRKLPPLSQLVRETLTGRARGDILRAVQGDRHGEQGGK